MHICIYTYIRLGAEVVLVPAITAEDTLSAIVVVEKAIVVVSFVGTLSCVMLMTVLDGLTVVVKAPVESEKYNTGSSCRFEHLSVHWD